MGDLNKYFNRSEFACRCGCGFEVVDHELLEVVSVVRVRFNSPVTINSACRCLEHNEAAQKEANKNYVPYSSESKHMQGVAADIVVKGIKSKDVFKFICEAYPDKYGVGEYGNFTHVDVRRNKARW